MFLNVNEDEATGHEPHSVNIRLLQLLISNMCMYIYGCEGNE